MDGMDEIVKEFVIESREGLDQVDRDLVDLEKDPHDAERLARIFRAIHTLKGTSGVLGFQKLESMSHVGENLLSRLRDRIMVLNKDIADSLLQLVDLSRSLLADIEQTGAETDRNCSAVVEALQGHLTGTTTTSTAASPLSGSVSTATEPKVQPLSSDGQLSSTIRVDVGLIDKVMTLVGELVLARNQVLQLTSSEKH